MEVEAQVVNSFLANSSHIEKMGVVTILFLVCMALLYLLKKANVDKQEVLKLINTHKEEMKDLIERDREDRTRLYEKMVEGITKTNQSIDEIKNISRQNQEIYSSFVKSFMEGVRSGKF